MRRLGQSLFILLLGLACERSPGAQRRALDDFGAPLPSFAQPPARVVSLAPSTTEIIFALGQQKRLVGRSRWDTWPAAASGIPELGDGIRPNLERVVAARPDLVILYAARDNEPAAQALRAAQIPVVALRIDRIDEYLEALTYLGRVLGVEVQGRALKDSLAAELARVRATTAGLQRPSVFVRVWGNPLMTIGRASFLSELIDIAGGKNVYNDLDLPSAPVSPEDVIARNPDVIVAGPSGLAELRENPAWKQVSAVQRGRLLSFDTALFSQPSMRMGRAAAVLSQQLHDSTSR